MKWTAIRTEMHFPVKNLNSFVNSGPFLHILKNVYDIIKAENHTLNFIIPLPIPFICKNPVSSITQHITPTQIQTNPVIEYFIGKMNFPPLFHFSWEILLSDIYHLIQSA